MEAMREAWTDERLDDLVDHMDQDFARVDARFDKFEDRVDARFERMEREMRDLHKDLEVKMDTRFSRLETRFDSLWRMMLAGYVTAVFGFIVTQL